MTQFYNVEEGVLPPELMPSVLNLTDRAFCKAEGLMGLFQVDDLVEELLYLDVSAILNHPLTKV
jgi:hypothetical protein